MKTHIYLFAGVISLLSFRTHAQQDPLYSQYMFNKLAINPAYAGVYDMASVTSIFRKQWWGIEGSPTTLSLSGNTSLPLDKAGAGITVISDQTGPVSNTEVEAAFAYKLVSPDGDSKFSMGLNIGFINQRINFNKVEVKDQNDPNFQGVTNVSKPSVGFGLYYTTPKYYAGFSLPRILNVDFDNGEVSGAQYKRHYYFNGGFLLETSKIKIVPSLLMRYVEGAPVSFDINGTAIINEALWAGLSFRGLNSVVISGQLQISDVVKAGLAYDWTFSYKDLHTIEVMLTLGFPVFDFHAVQPVYF